MKGSCRGQIKKENKKHLAGGVPTNSLEFAISRNLHRCAKAKDMCRASFLYCPDVEHAGDLKAIHGKISKIE